jgi:hypothetical protein
LLIRWGHGVWDDADSQDDIGENPVSHGAGDLRQELGFQKQKLLQPDGVLSQEKQLAMADRFRKRMAGNVRSDNRAPVLLQRKFNHAAVKSLSLDQSGDNIGKRYHYTRPPWIGRDRSFFPKEDRRY